MKLLPLALRLSLVVVSLGCHPGTTAASPNDAIRTPADSTVLAASEALAGGQPWRASRLLAPVLADSTRRSAEAFFVAATAASQWGGWNEVQRLLDSAPWIDTLYAGRGRALLARAALVLRRDSAALEHARAAVRTADGPFVLGERLVLQARALDRLEQRDSAAAAYAGAAELLPEAGEWLLLRAAAVTADSAARQALYARIVRPLVRERIAGTEATARRRAGDVAGARRAYEALGERATALRLALELAGTRPARDTIRQELLALVASGRAADARAAVAILDSAFPALGAAEELVVARELKSGGPLGRAAVAYGRALDARLGTERDRLAYGELLARLGRHGDAAAQLARIRDSGALGATAAYARARSLVRGGRAGEGLTLLRAIDARFAFDTAAASTALLLRADLATDSRDDSAARALLLDLARRYPSSRLAAGAAFRAAIIAVANDSAPVAALEFDSLAARFPRSSEAPAARYWAGRAWLAAGDTARAHERWREVLRRDPTSYYAIVSARRLGTAPWLPPEAADSFATFPALDSAIAAAALLERLGLDAEAEREYDQLAQDAGESVERLLATANAFRRQGRASASIRLAQKAIDRGAARDARAYRLIYPVVHADALLHEAKEQGLDPAFVAALIRQESMFNPAATSGVGARGLMQIMPEVGRGLAVSAGFPVWDPVLLYQPDVSLQLGTVHLQELSRRYTEPVHILAAYNAGASRVARWSGKIGVDDPELFAERIPYVETRDYVRVIQRNRELYRSLYSWPPVVTDALSLQDSVTEAGVAPGGGS